MRIFRRTLTVVAVAAAGTLTFALPASAHTPRFEASCDDVTITLTQFSDKGPNTVHISRDGQDLGGKLSPVTFGASTTIVVPEAWDKDTVTYRVSWERGDLADDFTNHGKRFFEDTLTKPENCDTKPAPPVTTKTATPPATSPAAPVKEVAPPPTHTATPSPTPTQAVEASKLANTGAGNTVPLLVVGAVLVAGGGALTYVTRRRRGHSASS